MMQNGNGIPCTQNGLSAWLTHFFFFLHHSYFTSQSISNNLGGSFFCLWFQAAAGFHSCLGENQSADLKLVWVIKSAKSNSTSLLECIVVYQHLKNKAICTFDKILGFFKSLLIDFYIIQKLMETKGYRKMCAWYLAEPYWYVVLRLLFSVAESCLFR